MTFDHAFDTIQKRSEALAPKLLIHVFMGALIKAQHLPGME
jgi:hypothetical protein